MSWLDPFFTAYATIQVAGSPLTQRATLNVGAGLTAVDDSANGRTTISLSGTPAAVTGTGLWYSTAGTLGAAAVTLSGDVTPSALSGTNLPLQVTGLLNHTLPAVATG